MGGNAWNANWHLWEAMLWNASWDAMFNMTKVELELISDAGKNLFFEKGMGGGVSYISKRYS